MSQHFIYLLALNIVANRLFTVRIQMVVSIKESTVIELLDRTVEDGGFTLVHWHSRQQHDGNGDNELEQMLHYVEYLDI